MTKFSTGLDDGHGMETAGKRTCALKTDLVFRGKTFKKGSTIHENDFNENLLELSEKALTRCGINSIQLAKGDSDVPLATRVNIANNNKVDLVVSYHANALGDKWQTKAYGLVVIHHVNCQNKTKSLAKNCYNHLSKEVDWYSNGGTKYGVRADTDISGYSLYVLKNTKMPAVLVEYGFMDNWEDVKRMCTSKFQNDCVEATVKGICETLGVKYVAPTTKPPASNPSTPDTNKKIYRVVCASYSKRENAEAEIKKLKKLGYSSFIDIFKKDNKNYYRVVAGSYSVKDNADKLVKELKGKGYSPFISN